MNLWTCLYEKFIINADLTALADEKGEYLTYGQLLKKVQSLAKKILINTRPGSRVAVLNNHSYFDAIGVLASLAAGCTVIPMSLKYGELNCNRIIQSATPQLLLTNMPELPGSILDAAVDCKTYILSVDVDLDFDKNEHIEMPDNFIVMIMFTSGTTGIPKGAMLSHNNILSNLSDIGEYFKLSIKDHILIVRPLYHAAVMTGEFLHALICGSCITFYDEFFSPRRLLNFINHIGCTTMCATPTLFYHLALSKKAIELELLQYAAISGECLHPKVAEQIIMAFSKVKFYNVYGLTEASPRVCYLPPEHFNNKVGSVGIPLKSINIKVVDQTGSEVAKGEIGELVVNGPNVMVGYWSDKKQTDEKIRNGWLYTGDLAYLDNEGFLYIMGRKDHMIIRAGVNIYPQEIENVLLEDDGIKEVIVWGEPDPRYGQRICASFVPQYPERLSEADIISVCRQRLQPYQWPDEVHLVDKLPRNASGKLIRGSVKI